MKKNSDLSISDSSEKENISENLNDDSELKIPVKKKKRIMVLTVVMLVFSVLLVFSGGYIIAKLSLLNLDKDISAGEFDENKFQPDGEIDPDNHAHENPEIGQRFEKVSSIPVYGNTKKITNILLLGIDSPDNNMYGRSDAIMILTLNHEKKEIKLTSIMRDTMVIIPGRDGNGDGNDDYDKLNHAYAYGAGKPDLLIQTIENNFRIKIEDYLSVNFRAFEKAVNAFGGIDMDLTAAEAGIVGVGYSSKTYHLNGPQTLTYARIRKIDTDFERTHRQRNVISALILKAKNMNIFQLDKVTSAVFPELTTNMTANELLAFIKYSTYKMGEDYRFPEEGGYTQHIYSIGFVFQLENPAESVGKLHDFIYK